LTEVAKEGEGARGVALMTAAKAFFVLGGLAVQLGLPRLLRSPEEYGLYATATALLAILTNTLTQGCVQTTSKHVSEGAGPRRSLALAAILGGALSLALFAAAEPLSVHVLHDPLVTPLLRVLALLPVAYAIYATSIGVLNGRRVFARQARLDATFTLVRTTGLLAGGALAIGALGAVIGFATAACVMACVGLAFVGLGSAGEAQPRTRAWLAFFAAIALHQLALNGLLQLDVEILKSRVASLAIAAGASAVDAASRASTEAGLYRAAQSVAFVPYQLVLAVTLVLFPTIARARTIGDAEGARVAVRGAIRFATIALVLVAAPVAGGGDAAIRVLLDARYAPGGDALTVLALAQIAFTLFVVGSTAISGDGAPFVVALSAALGLVVTIAVAVVGIDAAGEDGPVRVAAAMGAAAGCVVALVIAFALVRQRFGAAIPWLSLARGSLAGAAGFAVARLVPHGGRLDSLLALVVGAIASLVVLAISRELGAGDVALLRRVLRR
jgi:O-antigen/teichoic acid export membrane protein